ncbi:hypothetical protein [Metabacillus niabensis]|uniref:hypothetical protein n=1 Tax=Metabacillus niabensis TaxID=324854 RepID=UPI0036733F03
MKKLVEEWKVIDVDEFKMNRTKYHYPSKLVKASVHSLDTLKRRIARKEFPFNDDFLKSKGTIL